MTQLFHDLIQHFGKQNSIVSKYQSPVKANNETLEYFEKFIQIEV